MTHPRHQTGSVTHEETAYARASTYDDPTEDPVSTPRIICLGGRDQSHWCEDGPVRADRTRKSVGAENTFPADLLTYEAARVALREIAGKVWAYCEGSSIRGRTVTLKVKFANFQVITRSRTGQMQVRTRDELEELGNALLEPLFPVAKGIRLLGISLSSLVAEEAERELEFSLPV